MSALADCSCCSLAPAMLLLLSPPAVCSRARCSYTPQRLTCNDMSTAHDGSVTVCGTGPQSSGFVPHLSSPADMS